MQLGGLAAAAHQPQLAAHQGQVYLLRGPNGMSYVSAALPQQYGIQHHHHHQQQQQQQLMLAQAQAQAIQIQQLQQQQQQAQYQNVAAAQAAAYAQQLAMQQQQAQHQQVSFASILSCFSVLCFTLKICLIYIYYIQKRVCIAYLNIRQILSVKHFDSVCFSKTSASRTLGCSFIN